MTEKVPTHQVDLFDTKGNPTPDAERSSFSPSQEFHRLTGYEADAYGLKEEEVKEFIREHSGKTPAEIRSEVIRLAKAQDDEDNRNKPWYDK